jgi:hypothetical protein
LGIVKKAYHSNLLNSLKDTRLGNIEHPWEVER